ncbi:hypothetical protein M1397_03095 [Candidatus Marsarchaeota archaeon]|nr:hypothetical protein [Candidatus Marsarchaeota archaeon]
MQEIKAQIDELKKKRSETLAKIRDMQRRLNYKVSEYDAIMKLREIEKQQQVGNSRPDIGKLRRQKHSLEFKISTEAPSLSQEKALVRKINELNSQIEEALKGVRMARKTDFVKKDIEGLQATLSASAATMNEIDAKFDELYHAVRKLLGVQRRRSNIQQPQHKAPQPSRNKEINLEDIVVIKKKDKQDPSAKGEK